MGRVEAAVKTETRTWRRSCSKGPLSLTSRPWLSRHINRAGRWSAEEIKKEEKNCDTHQPLHLPPAGIEPHRAGRPGRGGILFIHGVGSNAPWSAVTSELSVCGWWWSGGWFKDTSTQLESSQHWMYICFILGGKLCRQLQHKSILQSWRRV